MEFKWWSLYRVLKNPQVLPVLLIKFQINSYFVNLYFVKNILFDIPLIELSNFESMKALKFHTGFSLVNFTKLVPSNALREIAINVYSSRKLNKPVLRFDVLLAGNLDMSTSIPFRVIFNSPVFPFPSTCRENVLEMFLTVKKKVFDMIV